MIEQHINQQLNRHHYWIDYAILITGAGLAVVALVLLDPSPGITFLLTGSIGVFYACWGVWHHARSQDLSWPVALEYVAFGSFISVLLAISLQA